LEDINSINSHNNSNNNSTNNSTNNINSISGNSNNLNNSGDGSAKNLNEARKSPVRMRKATALKKGNVVGTPDYLSPEILLGTGHGRFFICILIDMEYINHFLFSRGTCGLVGTGSDLI
jgi:hypothetical protein